MDLGLFQPKKAEIKLSEYKPRFNQPERIKRLEREEMEKSLRQSQRADYKSKSHNESNATENSIDKHDLSYLMAKGGDSTLNANDSRIIKAQKLVEIRKEFDKLFSCLLYTSPSPRDLSTSRMPSSA